MLYLSSENAPVLRPAGAVHVQLFMKRHVLRVLVNQCYIVQHWKQKCYFCRLGCHPEVQTSSFDQNSHQLSSTHGVFQVSNLRKHSIKLNACLAILDFSHCSRHNNYMSEVDQILCRYAWSRTAIFCTPCVLASMCGEGISCIVHAI